MVGVVAEPFGALDHGPVVAGVRRVGAVHRPVAVDDEAGCGVAVAQAHLRVELLEELGGGHGDIPRHGVPGTTDLPA